MSAHDPWCKWEQGGAPCRKFSTDGTLLGADIAHSMGTTDESKILEHFGVFHLNGERVLTGMDEEQEDWEAGL